METRSHHLTFERQVETTNRWLAELQADLGWDDRRRAFRALRAVMHALRDRLTTDEVAQLGAQLPMLVRGCFYENWQPRNRHRDERRLERFLKRIEEEMGAAEGEDVEAVTHAVFMLLGRHVSAGEIEDVLAILPDELRSFWRRPAGVPE